MRWSARVSLAAATLLIAASMGALRAAAADDPQGHSFVAVTLAPDGRHVAALEGDVPAGGGQVQQSLVIRDTTTGDAVSVDLPCGRVPECAPGAPAWSPDSTHIAFTVRDPGSHGRTIYTVDPGGRNLTQIGKFDGTVITLRFSPGGRLAALAVAGADKEAGATQPGGPLTGDIGADVPEQRIAIIEGGGLHWASPPDLFVYEYDWRPDGSGFVGTAAPGDGDAHWWVARLYAFDAASGSARELYAPSEPQQQLANPRIAPDGRSVAFIGGLMSDFDNPGGDAFVLPLNRPGPPVDITPGFKATVTSLHWDCTGGRLSAGLQIGGDTGIAQLDPSGAAPRMLWRGDTSLFASDGVVAYSCASDTTATIAETFTEADEIVVGPIGGWRKLTHANASITSAGRPVSITWTNDGMEMQGWLLLPPPGARQIAGDSGGLPVITVPHGGPAWAYPPTFYGPGYTRSLLQAGYALFLPNPRGSYGQGEAFTRANVRDLGHGDLRDILAGLDAVLHAPLDGARLDGARLGITGVSYGGFMTMWAATQTDRFKAAVARAGISNWQSYYGENGISDWMIPYFGASAYDDPFIYARSSPVWFVKNVRTPTLMMVGQDDIECPPPQSQEFWHALRAGGVPTGLFIYPGEGHEMRDPKHVADQSARAVAWFDRYLR